MTTKSKGESLRQKITTLSSKIGVRYSNLETAFLIERLVARLMSERTLAEHLVFKGGFVGLKVYGSHRYTVDLDAILLKSNIESTLQTVKERAIRNRNPYSKILLEALRRCFEFRETDMPHSFAEILESVDTTRLEKGWASAVGSITEAPSFKKSFDTVISEIHQLEMTWNK